MKKGMKHSSIVFICSLLIVYGVGFLGSIFTSGQTNGDWYKSVRPSITPPNWVFPIVWNILFLLIAISLSLSWVKSNAKQKKKIIVWYGINLISNALWSVLYFGLHSPAMAFIDLIIIFLSIIQIMFVVSKIDKRAVYLLLPYLIWVFFAGILNYLSIF